MNSSVEEKHESLKAIFKDMGKVLVAFSGGVDSTLLLRVAQDTLGNKNVLAVTALSPLYPERELQGVKKLIQTLRVRHRLIHSNELEIPGFSKNPSNRCYYCKDKLFRELLEIAKEEAVSFVVEGPTLDDDKDHRPG